MQLGLVGEMPKEAEHQEVLKQILEHFSLAENFLADFSISPVYQWRDNGQHWRYLYPSAHMAQLSHIHNSGTAVQEKMERVGQL